MNNHSHLAVGFVLALGALVCSSGLAQDAEDGGRAYKLCASCHGFKGEGNQLVNAPRLAGQEDWYLDRQIKGFRDGFRGSSTDDAHGQMMAVMTRGLESDEDIADIVAYILTLPVAKAPATFEGDLSNGKTQYGPCAACHGAQAEGNLAFDAPALAGMDDWYQLAQLEKYKNGSRGNDPADVYGLQMAPMAGVLLDQKAMIDVVAYINSLQ